MRKMKRIVATLLTAIMLITTFQYDLKVSAAELPQAEEVVEQSDYDEIENGKEETKEEQQEETISETVEEVPEVVEETPEEEIPAEPEAELEESEVAEEELVNDGDFKLTLDANGGKFSAGNTIAQLTYETTYLTNFVPTREGYVFTGWYADAQCTKCCSDDYDIRNLKYYDYETSNEIDYNGKTLYAGWTTDTVTVTVVFGTESGNDPEKNTGYYLVDGQKVKSYKVTVARGRKVNTSILNSSDVRNDDLHYSWDSSFYTDYDRKNYHSVYDSLENDTTLYIKYIKNKHVVTFHNSDPDGYFTMEILGNYEYNNKKYSTAKYQSDNILNLSYISGYFYNKNQAMVVDTLSTQPNNQGEIYTLADSIELKENEDLDLYVNWKLAGSILTLDANGGYFTEDNSGNKELSLKFKLEKGETYYGNSDYSIAHEDMHYYLEGWAETKNATSPKYKCEGGINGNYSIYQKVTPAQDGNRTLYAVWKKDINLLTLHPNGGTFTQTIYNGQLFDGNYVFRGKKGDQTYIYNTNVERDGYTFGGWYTDQQLTKPISLENYNHTFNGDQDIYAKWVKNVTVKFNTGNGTGAAGATYEYSIPEGNTLASKGKEVPPSPVANNGSEAFLTWCTDSALQHPISNEEILDMTISADTTFYAKYATAYTVTFNAGAGKIAGTNNSSYSVKVPQGQKIGGRYPSVTIADNGKVFKGWFVNSEEVKNVPDYTVSGNVTFNAQYSECYTITFHSNMDGVKLDGISETISVKVVKGEPFRYSKEGEERSSLFAVPTIENKKVNGKIPFTLTNYNGYMPIYSDKADGTGAKYYFSETNHEKKYKDAYDNTLTTVFSSTGFVPTSNMDLYIPWGEPITLKYSANGKTFDRDRFVNTDYYEYVNPYVSLSSDNKTIYYEVPEGISFEDLDYLSNYSSFYDYNTGESRYVNNWWLDTKGTKWIDHQAPITSAKTFYAKWENSSSSGSNSTFKEVTFHAKEGYFNSESAKTKTTSLYTRYPSDISVPIPTINDKSKAFTGWYTDEACTKPYDESLQFYNGKESNIVFKKYVKDLYAGYGPATYVKIDANGGYFDKDITRDNNPTESVKSVTTLNVKEPWRGKGIYISDYTIRVRRDGDKIFDGWYTDKECTKKADIFASEQGLEKFIPSGSQTTLYAKWVDYKPVKSIKVNAPSILNLKIGQKYKLKVETNPAGAEVKWIINDTYCRNYPEKDAVKLSTDGTVTALRYGYAYVYAEANGVISDKIFIDVANSKVGNSVILEETLISLVKGETYEVAAQVTPESSAASVTWKSSDENIAKVEGHGSSATIVAGAKEGSATITAALGSAKATMKVNVSVPILIAEDELGITARPDRHGNLTAIVAKDDAEVTWTSSDENIITVAADETDSKKAVVTPAAVFTEKQEASVTATVTIDGKTYTDTRPVVLYPVPTITAPFAVDDISKQPSPQNVSFGTKVRFAVAENGADIYYTVSNTTQASPAEPTESSTKYTGPIALTQDMANGNANQRITIKLIAIKNDDGVQIKSDVVTFSYEMKNANDDWGDVVDADKVQWAGNATNVPEAIWLSEASMTDDEDANRLTGAKTYSGKAIIYQDLRVYYGKTLLTEKTDYTITYKNNTNAAKKEDAAAPTITISGKGKYSGSFVKTFTIEPAWIDDSNSEIIFKKGYYLPATGKLVKPEITVNIYDEKTGKISKALSSKEYSIEYKDYGSATPTVNPGMKKVTVKGIRNYTGSIWKEYIIYDTKNTLDKKTTVSIKTTIPWAEGGVSPEIKLTDKSTNKALVYGQDYAVRVTYEGDGNDPFGGKGTDPVFYSNPEELIKLTSVGKYQIEIMANEDTYNGYIKKTVTVTGKDVKLATFKASVDSIDNKPAEAAYTGSNITPVYTVNTGKNTADLEAEAFIATIDGKDVASVKEVGKHTLVICGNNDRGFTSKKVTKDFTITGEKLDAKKVSYTKIFDYTGDAYTADDLNIVVKDAAGNPAEFDAKLYDTFVSATSPKNVEATAKAGKKKLVITGKNKYTGTLSFDVTVNAINVAKLPEGRTVTVSVPDSPCLKNGAKPEAIVQDNLISENLKPGVDYTVAYANNKAVADTSAKKAPTATITFKGNYTGKITKVFDVTQGTISDAKMTAVDISEGAFNPSNVKAALVGTDGAKLASGTDFTLKYYYKASSAGVKYTRNKKAYTAFGQKVEALKNDTVTPGTEILVVAEGIKNFANSESNESKNQTVVRVYAKNHDISKATFAIKDQFYTGSQILVSKDDITKQVLGKTVLEYGKDFVIDHSSYESNVAVGTAKVTLKGIGEYAGTKVVTFKIKAKSMNYTVVYDKGLCAADNTKTIANGNLPMYGKLAKSVYKPQAGYEFAGYSHTPQTQLPTTAEAVEALQNAIDYPAATAAAQPVFSVDSNNYPVGTTVTLFAWYKPVLYTIKYSGATVGADAPKTYSKATISNLNAALDYVPTKAGYTFTGWKLNGAAAGDAKYTKTYNELLTNPKAVTLTATWEKNGK